jgi:peroxiredoxin
MIGQVYSVMNFFAFGKAALPAMAIVIFATAIMAMPALADSEAKELGGGASGSLNGYVGTRLNPFTRTATNGKVVSTDAMPRALILNLWGINCASCLVEMKAIEEVYQEFKDRGLEIWAVNTEEMSAEEIEAGMRKKGLKVSYDLVPDPGLAISRQFTSWFIPVTVIIDNQGVVQYYKVGFNIKNIETIRAKVGSLLK